MNKIETTNDKIIIIFSIVLAIFLAVSFYLLFKKERAEVKFKDQNLIVKVELARNFLEHSRGLMGRKSLKENEGMLFIFNDEKQRRFWMKNTLIPLDLIFISGDYKIVEIKFNFEPCLNDPCLIYESQQKAKYVLEVNGGFCEKHKIKIGDSVQFNF